MSRDGQDTTPAVALDLTGPLAAGAGERIVAVTVKGLPEGACLSAGAPDGKGAWSLAPGDLDGLTLTPPTDGPPPFCLDVEARLEDDTGQTSIADLLIEVAPPGHTTDTPAQSHVIPLNLTPMSGAWPMTVHGLPPGATLTAGTDNGDGTWTVKGPDLETLALLPSDGFSGSISLTFRPAGDGLAPPTQVSIEVPAAGAKPSAPVKPRSHNVRLTARLVPIRNRRPTRVERIVEPDGFEADIPDLETAAAEMEALKVKIDELRVQLEDARDGTEAERVQTVSGIEERIADLKSKASDLRDEMERLRAVRDEMLEEAAAEHTEEIARLKADSQTLRDRLEALRDEGPEATEKAVQAAREEISTLQQRVGDLRDEAEVRATAYREQEDAIRSDGQEKITALKEEVSALRDQLEAGLD